MRCHVVVILLLVLVPQIALAQPAGGDAPGATGNEIPPEAKEHYEIGVRHYNLQEWSQAVAEYKEAYRLSPRPAFLWAIAQAQRLGGDCEAAIKSYQAFLRSSPSAEQAAIAWEFVAKCQAEVAEKEKEKEKQKEAAELSPKPDEPKKVETADKKPDTAHPPSSPERPPPPSEPARWYSDWLGHTLFFGGAAAAVAGGVVLGMGNGSMQRANDASDYATFETSAASGQSMQQWGVGGLVVGGALAAGGVIRYIVVARRASASNGAMTATVTGFVGPSGAVLGISGRF